jgi:hypothetical protein
MGTEQNPRRSEPRAVGVFSAGSDSLLTFRTCTLLTMLISLSVATAALGQRRPSTPKGGAALARYAPASANLFLTVRRLDEMDAAMRRAHAWRLLPLLAGNPIDNSKTFNVRSMLANFVGARSSINIDDVMKTEIGIVAPSWLELGSAVWLVRLADDSVLERWFPDSRARGGGDSRAARFFGTADDMLVCVRDDVAVMARRKGSSSLLSETMLLMAGKGGTVLEQAPEYQELVAYLPDGALAVTYVSTSSKRPAESVRSSAFWPDIDRAVAGLYEGDGRIDVAIRASLRTSETRQVLSSEAIDRLVYLPQTTLLATATTIDLDSAYETATKTRSTAALGRLLTLLAGLRSPATTPPGPFPQLGPHVIMAWDQDLRGETSSPQLAFMVQCADARRLRDEANEIAGNALKLVKAVDIGTDDPIPSIMQTTHLGTPIEYISFRAYAEKSKSSLMRLLGAAEPAWAAVDGWFIFALSRNHIERILDARHGLTPPLSNVPDVQALRRRRVNRTALSIVQADLAADVLNGWLKSFEAGSPSLLDPSWWRKPARPVADKRQRLGIGMKTEQKPGVVVVARVYPGSAADGHLQPDDRIIGIDGNLLDLTSPNTDLRRRWAGSKAEPGPALRVQRGDTIFDVVLPRNEPAPRVSAPQLKPADAVRELASLARELQFASFASYASQPMRYSARLSLRFAPTPSP